MCGYEERRLLDTDEVFVTCLQVLSLSFLRSPRAAPRPFLWKRVAQEAVCTPAGRVALPSSTYPRSYLDHLTFKAA
ncbi:hypothetical protein R6Z07F_009267 [Ovis aries]